MDKSKKSQILKLSLLAALVFITPLLSSSIRPTYLYFIINLLIIALGAEAGFLSSFSKPSEDKKPPASLVTPHDKEIIKECSIEKKMEKSVSEKIVKMMDNKVNKCLSLPSLFFIGGDGEESEGEEFVEINYEEEVGDNTSGQEKDQLFNKAEMFIGNFYNRCKERRFMEEPS